ncbi:MAG: hypothetical protein ABI668_00870 [Sphingorhabdus sp.]
MSVRNRIGRLFGYPYLAVRYRPHFRIAFAVHPLILKLIEDNADGDTRRASLAEWHRAERPVLSVLRGTTSLLRIDGPRQCIGNEAFAMGSLIESPGVTAHLDPVETLQLEGRVRVAIEQEILRWISEHDLQSRPPVEASVDRDIADPKAIRRMLDWVERDRWTEEQSYVG